MGWIIDGKEYSNSEYMELKERERTECMARCTAEEETEEKARQEATRLMRQVGQAYAAFKEFMSRHPQLGLQATQREAADHNLCESLRANLERADQAPRCSHIKADGVRCGSPQTKSGALCYAHQRMAAARPQALRLPPMEDPNAIQLGLMEVARALIDRQITERTAGLLFYGLQTAAANVDRLTFHEAPQEMVLDDNEPVITAEAAKQEGFSYEMLDQDLKLRLQEIGDEMDRRLREKRSREKHTNAGLATEDTKEHRGGPEIAGTETRFGVETNADSGRDLTEVNANKVELRREDAEQPRNPESLTTEDTKGHRGEALTARPETHFAPDGDGAETSEAWPGRELPRPAASAHGMSSA
jgi:hypothetical protein